LADARFVLEPKLYGFDVERPFARDFIQARGEVFLKILNRARRLGMVTWPAPERLLGSSRGPSARVVCCEHRAHPGVYVVVAVPFPAEVRFPLLSYA
jgi:hypothetical protein